MKIASLFPGLIENAIAQFAGIVLEDSYECSIAIVRRLQTIDQTQFEKDFREVVQNYEALAPHAVLARRDVRDRYEWLLTIYHCEHVHRRRHSFAERLIPLARRIAVRVPMLR